MGWEKFKQKSGCLLVKAIDETTIREAIKNGTMMKYPHYACPLSCPCKIWEFIENVEDPNFLLRDLVMKGRERAKLKNWKKSVKAHQDFENPNDPFPIVAKKKLSELGDLKLEIFNEPEPAKYEKK